MYNRRLLFIIVGTIFGILHSCDDPELPESVQQAYKDLPKKIDFNKDIKPILSDKCFICHGPDKANVKAALQLHLPELAFAELKSSPGKFAIKPGNLNQSQLVRVCTTGGRLYSLNVKRGFFNTGLTHSTHTIHLDNTFFNRLLRLKS